jgi:hypothetical protein
VKWSMVLTGVLGIWTAIAAGQSCTPFWTGVDSIIGPNSLAVFDDGSGPMLYAAGRVYPYGPPPTYAGVAVVARWNGTTWQIIDDGLPPLPVQVTDLLLLDDGEGAGIRLHTYVRSRTPIEEWILMRWTGSAWESARAGLGGPQGWPYTQVNESAGPVIYGLRWADGSVSRHEILRWSGDEWVVIGLTNTPVNRMASVDLWPGPQLHVAGSFNSINGISLSRIARWTGDSWEPLGTGIPPGAGGIRHMITHDDGRGPALYVTDILQAGGIPVNRIGRWDGRSWSDVGGGGISSIPITTIHVLASFDDGFGPALFAGGYMHSTGHGLPLRRIARFDGVQWDDVGGGLGGAEPQSMVVYDDGRGPSLFVGGVINSAGAGAPGSTFGIAQWVGCHNQCYVNCDNSRVGPRLNIDDFTCFINKFAVGDPYVDCDGDRQRTIADFHCFMTRFAQGCP